MEAERSERWRRFKDTDFETPEHRALSVRTVRNTLWFAYLADVWVDRSLFIEIGLWEECGMVGKQKAATITADAPLPMLKTVEQMSRISGLGENKIRELMDRGELEYIQNGNRRLLVDRAI